MHPAHDATNTTQASYHPRLRELPELRRWLFWVAAIASSLALMVELASRTAQWQPLGSCLALYLAALNLVAWLGLWRHGRGHAAVWVAITAEVSLATQASSANLTQPGPLLAGILATLVWSGLVLRPAHNVVLSATTLPLLLFNGLRLDGAHLVADGSHRLPLVILFLYLAIPIATGAALQRASDLLSRALVRRLADASSREGRLTAHLRSKSSELKDSQAQLLRAQKLETVGTMASGLAHELNNILTPIRGLAELLASGLVGQAQAQHYGRQILKSAISAGRITSSLLAYTWQGAFQPVRTNARDFLTLELLPELSNRLPHGVALKAAIEEDVWIDVDRMQLQHCVTNLVLNASDAMPDGGTINVRLRTRAGACPRPTLSTTATAARPSGGRPRHAVCDVSDEGVGIRPEHLEDIFDPFFTTKAIGAGTGLGLALVQGVVTRHGGSVRVVSRIGQGTTFTLHLPLAALAEPQGSLAREAPDWDPPGPAIMVVMEDIDELDELEEILADHECSPLCCRDVEAAQILLQEAAEQVQALILDTQLDTVEMEARYLVIRRNHPKLPIILLANEPASPATQALIGTDPTRAVRKPLDGRTLTAMLRELLPGSTIAHR
ncbi:MAG: ATP-binding protein [Nannocystaceae bacterium]